MARRVTWTNNSTSYDGTEAYRDTTIDPQNLTEPIATVDPVAQGATVEYIDLTGSGDQCYAVRDFDSSGDGALSDAYCFDASSSFRYWRLHITQTRASGGFNAQLAEIEFREQSGVGWGSPAGTASASSFESAMFSPANAFDGDPETDWLNDDADSAFPYWIRYDHDSPSAVVEVLVQAVTGSSTVLNRSPRDFTIEYSDNGTDWTVAAEIIDEPEWGSGEARTYAVSI